MFGDMANVDIMPVIKYGTRKVQGTAKDLAPVDTGYLKDNIFTKMYPKELSGVVYTVVEYAPHQEYGTRYVPANPFMTPALNINRAGIAQVMKAFLKVKTANPKANYTFPTASERAGRDFIYIKKSSGSVKKEKKQKGEKNLRKNLLRNK
jgi:HK97 gp10 family phage protein